MPRKKRPLNLAQKLTVITLLEAGADINALSKFCDRSPITIKVWERQWRLLGYLPCAETKKIKNLK